MGQNLEVAPGQENGRFDTEKTLKCIIYNI